MNIAKFLGTSILKKASADDMFLEITKYEKNYENLLKSVKSLISYASPKLNEPQNAWSPGFFLKISDSIFRSIY